MARRSRRYSGFGSFGGLSLNDSVKVQDVLVGAVVGVVGSVGLNYALKKFAPDIAMKLDAYTKLLPAASGAAVGAALFYGQKGSSQAVGHAVGAALAGLAVTGLTYVKEAAGPAMAGFGAPAVALNLGNYSGLLVDNTVQRPMAMNGLIVDNNANLGALGAASMGGDDEMGYADIVALRS